MSATTKKNPKSEGGTAATKRAAKDSSRQQTPDAVRTGEATSQQKPPQSSLPPPGLDEAQHAKAQAAAKGADLLREGIFPALMASALGFDKFVETAAFKVFLDRFLIDLGAPKDPIERMLAEQLALVHFRLAKIQVDAAQAKSLEAVKLYNTVCARLIGEFRRSALTLRALRSPPTAEGQRTKLRVFKAVQ